MRFVLHYRGPLKSNGDPKHKQEIREAFRQQLATLWGQKPLSDRDELLKPPEGNPVSALRTVGGITFAPLVTEALSGIAELEIVMLRPGAAGQLLSKGGDIDNRLKTLFDALSVPPHENQVPSTMQPGPHPFFCLLEDDRLVTAVAVRAEQLLEPAPDGHVDLTVTVTTGATQILLGNPIG